MSLFTSPPTTFSNRLYLSFFIILVLYEILFECVHSFAFRYIFFQMESSIIKRDFRAFIFYILLCIGSWLREFHKILIREVILLVSIGRGFVSAIFILNLKIKSKLPLKTTLKIAMYLPGFELSEMSTNQVFFGNFGLLLQKHRSTVKCLTTRFQRKNITRITSRIRRQGSLGTSSCVLYYCIYIYIYIRTSRVKFSH